MSDVFFFVSEDYFAMQKKKTTWGTYSPHASYAIQCLLVYLTERSMHCFVRCVGAPTRKWKHIYFYLP